MTPCRTLKDGSRRNPCANFINAAFATPTLNGDDSYDAVHMTTPKDASQTSTEPSNSWGLNQANSRAPKATGLINDPTRPYYFS